MDEVTPELQEQLVAGATRVRARSADFVMLHLPIVLFLLLATLTGPSPSSRMGCSMTARSPTTTQVSRSGTRDALAAARMPSGVCASMRCFSVRT